MNLFESSTKMPGNDSKDVVTSATDKPENGCLAQVPSLCKWDNHIQHAPIPRIGAKG